MTNQDMSVDHTHCTDQAHMNYLVMIMDPFYAPVRTVAKMLTPKVATYLVSYMDRKGSPEIRYAYIDAASEAQALRIATLEHGTHPVVRPPTWKSYLTNEAKISYLY